MKPSEIISGRAVPPAPGSFGHADPILIHYKGVKANPTSSGNIWEVRDFGKYGYASPQIDDGVWRGEYCPAPFGSWKAGSKPPAMNEYVKIPQTETVAIASFSDIPWQTHEGQSPLFNKYTREFHVSRMNDAGRMLSKIENSRQRVRRYSETELAEVIEGKPVEKSLGMDYLAVGGLPEGALYGIFRADNGGIVLAVSNDMYEWASLEARALGIDTESYLEIVVGEEHAHRVRRSFDKPIFDAEGRIGEEYATKDYEYSKLENIAKGAEGGNPRNPKYQRARRRLQLQAALKEADRDSVGRYRKVHGYNSRGIADESGKASFDMKEDGKITATYDGNVVGDDGASMPIRFVGNYLREGTEEKNGGKIDSSQIKSMNDVKEREAATNKETPQEAPAEAGN
ncbi:hypothetical protein HYV80_06630 [Candidatus Woesearchaeota archaeon]|nr:hypothetical protein [Candidatus Woesearchaeota archaeon]